MGTYDRRMKTAAKMDLYKEWSDIVQKHTKAMEQDFADLLKELAKYLGSVGYNLDIGRSYLGVSTHGSDGRRLAGELFISERPENTVKNLRPDQVKKWVEEATGMYGTVRPNGPDAWTVDISES